MIIRIALALCAFVSILFGPLWVSVLLGIILAARWEAWEVILLGLLIDFLYLPLGAFWYMPIPVTLLAMVFVWVMVPVRKRIFIDRA